MRTLDTNVLVRLITRDNEDQVASAMTFVAQGAWVSVLVLTELTWVLASVYKLEPAHIADALDMLLGNANLIVQDSDAVAAAVGLFRAQPALGFSDCLVLHVARKAGHLPLGTFDRNLARVEGTQKL